MYGTDLSNLNLFTFIYLFIIICACDYSKQTISHFSVCTPVSLFNIYQYFLQEIVFTSFDIIFV